MKIAGYLPTSLIEWPGKIAAVVFTPGCNFLCPFCHNRDLVLPSSDLPDIPDLPGVSEGKIFTDLKKRKKWIDGVVVTGGEPTLQPDLVRFLSRLKQMGLATMIETNGSKPEVISKLVVSNLVDFIAMDIKMSLEDYPQVTKCQMSNLRCQIESSVKLISESGVEFEFRTTVVPTLHDKKNMVKLARQLRAKLQSCKAAKLQNLKWVLQSFQPKNCLDPKFNEIKPYSPKEMEEILVGVKKYIPGAELRGV